MSDVIERKLGNVIRGQDEQIAALQARLAQCEGALKLRDDELKKQQEASLVFVRERDAALERVREVEAAKEAVYSTLVDERKRLYALEAAVKAYCDARNKCYVTGDEGLADWQTYYAAGDALLALRAGMA